MPRNKKFVTKSHVLTALGTLAVSILLLTIFWWAKGDTFLAGLYSIKSRDGQLMEIASAVTLYQMRHHSPPNSLSNLVSEGLLPDTSHLYPSCLVRWKYNPAPIRFVESDYEIVPTTNGAIARLKPGSSIN